MPQASEELRELMNQRFGDPIDDSGPINYLYNAGYILTPQWTWYKPGIQHLGQMEREEFECLLFLVHEWDFGGLADEITEDSLAAGPTGRTSSEDGDQGEVTELLV